MSPLPSRLGWLPCGHTHPYMERIFGLTKKSPIISMDTINNNFLGGGEILVLGITILVIIAAFLVYRQGKDAEFTVTESNIDGLEYVVRNVPDKKDAANKLATLRSKMIKLCDFLKKKYPKSKKINRMIDRYQPDVIRESPRDTTDTSYSINKGEKLIMCIRSKDSTNELVDSNTMTFVALHELAHVMTKSVGHTNEFWNNFKFILKNAIESGVYKYQNFKQNPEKYCGMNITHTPYDIGN